MSFPAVSAEQWQVSGVESWDTLNLRSQPGVVSDVIGKIPFDAENIIATGEEQGIGKTVWKKIEWDGKQGWVSKAYLAAMPEETGISEAEQELATGIVEPDGSAGDAVTTENLMPDTVAEDTQQEKPESGKLAKVASTKPEKIAKPNGNDGVASDGMTDLEALSILAQPAIADPAEEQGVSVMPASLKIMKEE